MGILLVKKRNRNGKTDSICQLCRVAYAEEEWGRTSTEWCSEHPDTWRIEVVQHAVEIEETDQPRAHQECRAAITASSHSSSCTWLGGLTIRSAKRRYYFGQHWVFSVSSFCTSPSASCVQQSSPPALSRKVRAMM